MSSKVKKIVGIVVDVCMYVLMVTQMLYVIEGNPVHEVMGMLTFVLLLVHLWIKKWWFKKRKRTPYWVAFDIVCVLMLIVYVVLVVSSMSVSRTLFPGIMILTSPWLHRMLATALFTLATLHGCFHMYKRMEKKKKAVVITVILCIAAMSIGLFGVPYLNRHYKKIDVKLKETIEGEKLKEDRSILTVYFTRVGNTDFDEDVDAVSGASLLLADGELMGNTQILALMVQDAIGCDVKAINLTGELYPSSYGDTVMVAGDEIKSNARPEIEDIDVENYDSIILVYPMWWGTIPNPVATFLESQDFEGRKIYLLCTQGSTGFASTTKNIKQLVPKAEVIEGLSIYCEDITTCREQIGEWLSSVVGE